MGRTRKAHIPDGKPTKLSRALEKTTVGYTTKQTQAKNAGVSTSTLLKVLNHEFATEPPPSECGNKQLKGYAEALTRLAISVGLDPKETVKEYGLNSKSSVVLNAITQVQLRQTIKRGLSDPVLDAIQKRKQPTVHIGVLRWPPFVDDVEMVQDSWAYDYCVRLVGAVNPDWEKKLVEFDTIDKAIGALLETRDRPAGMKKGGPKRVDLCFGIYDTTYRQYLGLDFVHLPALGVPLGAIFHRVSSKDHNQKLDLDWAQVIHHQTSGDGIQAVVIEKEIGHLYLKGPRNYSEKDLIVVKEGETKALAASFVQSIVEGEERGAQVVFVADKMTCDRVYRELTESKSWLANIPSAESRRECSKVADELVPLTGDESAKSLIVRPPAYRVGIAVRADAERWHQLLTSAQNYDLFNYDEDLTAKAYTELIMKPFANLRRVSFDRGLPNETAVRFDARFFDRLYTVEPKTDDEQDLKEKRLQQWFPEETKKRRNTE